MCWGGGAWDRVGGGQSRSRVSVGTRGQLCAQLDGGGFCCEVYVVFFRQQGSKAVGGPSSPAEMLLYCC